MSVNEFRSLSDPDVQIFQARTNNDLSGQNDTSKESLLSSRHKCLRNFLQKFEEVFQAELAAGLRLKREVDHEI